MAGTIMSEKKKDAFIQACEDLDPLTVLPEKILQAQRLIEILKKDEIEANMLYKCGCPYEWIKASDKYCLLNKGKLRKPKYSNDCTVCWIKSITEEMKENVLSENKYQEIVSRLNSYEKFKLSPEQLEQILSILEWNKTYDFDFFVNKIIEMKVIKDNK
ncbi:hypothetical protein [Lacrimispora amygdalina]|uniref:hypothetical protein n=1 Tax=Lacrimispora amygdalina TaxID=253257 RepID=UPI000BE3B698|nr:hypothetical protein [Lacrimispora amygdalina]